MEEIKSTVEHLQDLIDAREDMKTSINNKGVQVSGGLKSYADAIDRIPQNVVVGTGEVEYTTNGSYTIDANDYSVDALRSIDVNVNIPTKKVGINTRTINITKNGVGFYKAKDYSNFDGLSQVAINVDVPTKTLSTASKEYTKNGSYTINASDYSVDGLSQVELEINVPQNSGSGGNYEIDLTRIGYSLGESKIANEANVIFINNEINNLDKWSENYTNYNNWSATNPNGVTTIHKYSPWRDRLDVFITPPIFNLNSDGRLDTQSGIFEYLDNLRYISPFDTSKVTSMYRMFYFCRNLLGIPMLDTSNVTWMTWMFCNCISLTTIPQLDTSKVETMERMFQDCKSLKTIPLLNTSNVTDMEWMFYGCTSLTTIPQLDTSDVTNMEGMFLDCKSLKTIPLLDTSDVIDMSRMFYGCTSLTTIPQLDTSKVAYMYRMFEGCTSLTTIPLLELDPIEMSHDLDMSLMFSGCTSLKNVGGFRNLGTNLDLSDCSKLTFNSFENIVNNMSIVTKERTLTVNETALYNWDVEDRDRLNNLTERMIEKGWMLMIP